MGRRRVTRCAVWAWFATVLLFLMIAPTWAGEREQADLFLSVDARGDARVILRLGFEPPAPLPLEARLAEALGAPIQDARRDADEDGVSLLADCQGMLRRRGW